MTFKGVKTLFWWLSFLCSMGINHSRQDLEQTTAYTNQTEFQTSSGTEQSPIVLSVFLLLVGITSIFCNSLIIHSVRVNSYMHTATNYLIVNMAIGDLAATIVSVVTLMNVFYNDTWFMDGLAGELLCKLKFYMFFCPLHCSIFSLVAISIDRFMAVVRPLSYKQTKKGQKYSICAVWLTSLLVPLHHIIKNAVLLQKELKCLINDSKEDTYFLLIAAYALPHLVMIVLYVPIAVKLYKRRVPGEQSVSSSNQQNQNARETATKVTKMIFCILIAFNVCWGPLFILSIGRSLHEDIASGVLPKGVSKIFVISNGICNTIIYAIFNANFRKAFKNVLRNETMAFAWNRFSSTFRTRSLPVSTQGTHTH